MNFKNYFMKNSNAKLLLLPFLVFIILGASLSISHAASFAENIREKINQRKEEKKEQDKKEIKNISMEEKSVMHDGLDRKYLVYLPHQYQENRKLPVIFAFHGGAGSMKFQSDDSKYGIISKANKEGFIAVFPNGYSRFPGGKFATWNAGNCCGDAKEKQIDDVGFVRKIVQDITNNYSSDRNRFFATGMSNGGMFSYKLACEMSDVFKAVAPVAGTDGVANCKPKNPVSILHIHAKNDTHVLFDGGAGPNSLKNITEIPNYTSVPNTILKWANLNSCTGTPQKILQKAGAYCEVYSNCSQGSKVQLCVTETGGHSWPGALTVREGKESSSQAISANDMMWDFFSKVNP